MSADRIGRGDILRRHRPRISANALNYASMRRAQVLVILEGNNKRLEMKRADLVIIQHAQMGDCSHWASMDRSTCKRDEKSTLVVRVDERTNDTNNFTVSRVSLS